MPPPEILFVAGVFFIASLTRATFGFGEALIAMPLLAFVMPMKEVATPLVAINASVMALVVVLQDWRHIHFGSARRLLAATLVGAPFGLWWLSSISDFTVKLLLAILIVSFSTFSLARSYWRARRIEPDVSSTTEPDPPDEKDWLAYVFGFFAGLIGSVYLTFGPPLVIYGAIRSWKPQQFRATLQGYFLVAGLCVLVMHAATGLWTRQVFEYVLWTVPVLAVTLPIGSWLNRSIPAARFLNLVYVGLLFIALSLILRLVFAESPPFEG